MTDTRNLKVPRPEPVDITNLPKALPKIEVDYAKCTVPMWCKKCLRTCPQLVFATYCKQFVKARESDPREPGVYELLPVRRDKCIMCGQCVDVCPEGALTISTKDKVLRGSPKGPRTADEAKKSPYPLFIAPKQYSFDLNMSMINLLRQEFDPKLVVAQFAQAVASVNSADLDKVAKEVFGQYGQNWMKKVIQLGEEYPDRTYETLKEVIDLTGDMFFPLVPQRFIEIAYLSTQDFLKLSVRENYGRRIVYQVPNCRTFKLINEQMGPVVAGHQPCQHACLAGLETLFKNLELEVSIERKGIAEGHNYCEYTISRI